jgi:monoterpene epsilon-lactone hydrolase
MPSAEHEAMVARIVASGMRTPEEADPSLITAMRDMELVAPRPEIPDMDVADVTYGGVPCLEVTPVGDGATSGTVVYVHGGGYIWMRAATHIAVAAAFVRATGCRCISADYRRAPEHAFPAPVEDLVAVYRALLDAGEPPGTIAFAGDSAGGGLVIAGLVALRDARLPLPAAGVSISPWSDLAVTGESADTVDDPIVSGNALRMMAGIYLAGADPRSPIASPLYADLAGLPPLLVQVGTRESLLDDARRVAAHAGAAGVDVTLTEYEDVIHMWVVSGPDIPESLAAYREAGEFVLAHLLRET